MVEVCFMFCSCFTTEILEGFDVQRTSGLSDTLKKYGYLTHAITQYYILQASDDRVSHSDVCPRLDQFIKKCQELDKMTVSDVFALQLMQVWTAFIKESKVHSLKSLIIQSLISISMYVYRSHRLRRRLLLLFWICTPLFYHLSEHTLF